MSRRLTHAGSLVAGLVALVTCARAQADLGHLSLVGVLVSEGKEHVILVDSVSGRSSGWIQVGQSFGDDVVTQYNAATDTVVVSCRGATRAIPLVDARTVSGFQTIQLGTKAYAVFADARERRDGGIVFRGNVTVLGDGLRVSADEARFEPAGLALQGQVRVERDGVLMTGTRAVLHPDARALVLTGATLLLRGAAPAAPADRAPQP